MESPRDERAVRPASGPAAPGLEDWDRSFAEAGASPAQFQRLWFHALRGRPASGPAAQRGAPFGRRLLAEVARFEAELDRAARPLERFPSADGAERLVLGLADGRRVEAVALPSGSACLSSQVGCAVACRFCMTGQGGLERQLTAFEILACWLRLARARPLRRALFMGMGEPAHNLSAVLAAGQALAERAELGRHHVVVSSVGDPRLFDRLESGPFRPALALSLHSADPDLRRRLLPHAAALSPAELVAAGESYARRGGYPIQYQWALLAGVNDSDRELLAAAELLRGKRAVLNLIPWNPLPGLPFERPERERCRAAVRLLMQAGILTKLRWSAGLEAEAACGQLRSARPAPAPPAQPPEPLASAAPGNGARSPGLNG